MARIFVIDDDEQLLRMVGMMLERGGHTITLLNNPLEGLERIKQDQPDLLVLDVMMPNMSGHDLAREIRKDKMVGNLPILVLTARSQEIDKTTALKSGANDYLSKPVTSQELIERVDALLTNLNGNPSQQSGFVISVFGFRGGVGKTTLAVNTAAALRRISQQEVLLFDMNASSGQALAHMRLQSRTSWNDLPQDGNFDWEELKEHLIIHPSGLRVLPAPTLPVRPLQLSDDVVQRVIELSREQMTFAVVDTPSYFSPAFDVAMSEADMALHVLSPDVISVQTASQVNRLLRKSGINVKRKSHILNQTTPDAQLPQSAVERGLNARVSFQIGYDLNQSRAIAQGVPLVLTSAQSTIPVVIKRMAEAIWQRVAASQEAVVS